MATEAGVAYVQVQYDTGSISKLRAQTESEVTRASSSWRRLGTSMRSVGQSMTRNLTLPIVGAAAAATKYTYDFDQSLNHIQALVGASSKQMDQYRQAILSLAPTVGQGPDELAKALYFITSSGYSGAKALDVLKASARAAASGLGDTQQVADLVTTAVAAYGAKTLSAAHATDILTQAVKLGKAEPADFVSSLGRVIPVAQAMGVSFGEVSGAVASLTLSGQSTEIAVTGLRQVLLNILKPTAEARDALKGVGLSAKDLQTVVSKQGILPALELLNKRFHGNRQEMSKVISNARSLTVAMALIGPNADKASKTIDAVTNSSGAANAAFQKQSQTMAFQVQKAWATIQTAAIQAGSIILPVFARIATGVASVATRFGDLTPRMQELIVIAGLSVGALGPVITVVSNLALAFGKLKLALFGVQGGFKGLLPLIATNPWVAVGLAVAAAGAYFLLTRDRTSEMSRAMDEARHASDELGRAMEGLKASNLDVRQAELDRKDAADQFAQTSKRVTRLIDEGKKGTKEYSRALRDQQRAEVDLGYAKLRVQQVEADRAAKAAQVAKANKAYENSLLDIGKAAQDAAKDQGLYNKATFAGLTPSQKAWKLHQLNALATKQFADHVGQLAREQSNLAKKYRSELNPTEETAHTKTTALALAALDLTHKLGHVPTDTKMVVRYYKTNMDRLIEQARLLEGAISSIPSYKKITIQEIRFGQGHGTPIAQQPHTGGLITREGLRLATGGFAVGGIPGQDSVPALLTPGELVLNREQQLRLFRLLNNTAQRVVAPQLSHQRIAYPEMPRPVVNEVHGGGDTYLTVKIGERDITDIIDTRVERRERHQSRRLTARGAH